MEVRVEGQTEWGWKVAAYLSLAGVGAGAYAVGAVADFAQWEPISKIGISMGFPLLFIGSLFLIADLGVKVRALRAFMNPGTSWIARGTFIISIFMILGAIHIAAWIWPFSWLEKLQSLRYALAAVNLVFAFLAVIYTGVLLGASRPIAFWSTAALPVLFLVSGLSTGLMGITLVLLGYPGAADAAIEEQLIQLQRIDIFVIILETVVLAFYLQATHRTVESVASATLLMKGRLAPAFWGIVVVMGLAIPLLAGLLEAFFLAETTLLWTGLAASISSVTGLVGGLWLRRLILAAGVRAPLRAAGIEFAMPVPTRS